MLRPVWCWKDVTISGVDGNPNGMWFGSGSNEGAGNGDEIGKIFAKCSLYTLSCFLN